MLEPHAGQPIEPWTRITGHLRPDIAVELRAQLGRVAGDLAMAGAPPDSG